MLVSGAALMECEKFEEGFAALDEVLDALVKWYEIPYGTLLPVGTEKLYANIRIPKGEIYAVMPDGSREWLGEDVCAWKLDPVKHLMYSAIMDTVGRAWFNPVRNHHVYGERFKEYIEKALTMIPKS